MPIPGTLVVGIGHKARHGKDTAAQAIVRALNATRYGFADDLYAVCRVLHGMTTKDAPLLQRVGVEYRERYGADVWVRAVYAKLLADQPHIAVIPDVRFPNELAFVKALGGVTIKVQRYADQMEPFIDPSRPADHISETALDDAKWDYTISNSGRIGDLQSAAITLADRVYLQFLHRPAA